MPSRCTCVTGWNPECKRHGEARRAQATAHKRQLWAEAGETMAETQRIYRNNRQPQLRGAHRLEVMVNRPEDWKAQAACQGKDRSLFYVEVGENATEAKAICRGCPVRIDCLEYALAIKEEHGIWGGMNEKERTRYARNRARSQVA